MNSDTAQAHRQAGERPNLVVVRPHPLSQDSRSLSTQHACAFMHALIRTYKHGQMYTKTGWVTFCQGVEAGRR